MDLCTSFVGDLYYEDRVPSRRRGLGFGLAFGFVEVEVESISREWIHVHYLGP